MRLTLWCRAFVWNPRVSPSDLDTQWGWGITPRAGDGLNPASTYHLHDGEELDHYNEVRHGVIPDGEP